MKELQKVIVSKNKVYKIEKIIEEKAPEEKKFVESDAKFGTIKTKTPAQPAVSARLVKTVYINGEQKEQEVENYSSYLEVKEVVEVGVSSDNTEAVEALKAAIREQSEDKINKVIEKYKGEESE